MSLLLVYCAINLWDRKFVTADVIAVFVKATRCSLTTTRFC